ncbi:hypothetical protein BIV57_09370 [Mangrovactinospora gilvigrisea]|uniref:HTH tetR-type domain-containing protein n=1 Tax=Mangrovactinospora gilvigrisea TaxID=1428644 RepID=A0A1J7BGY5_9ACTN|nr:TetR family transcriptional regulator [Mangrovactinospora gilvigrisea]OIV37829.1 hypothetical protein BIV57_09370 [Mangrovactinospora gilvigrisea]
MRSKEDFTTRARIRDAALARFGQDGIAKSTLRAVAADAGVSAPLVVHHFGSKAGLMEACDQFVLELVQHKFTITEGASPEAPPISALGDLLRQVGPMQRYLAQAFRENTPGAARIFEIVVDRTEDYLDRMQENGEVVPSDDNRARAATMITWHLGFVVLGDHLAAAIGEKSIYDLEAQMRAGRQIIDIYSRGLFTDPRWVGVTERIVEDIRKDGER